MAAEPSKVTRVLYVEDDRDLQFSMSQILRILGYQVECADNGKLGVEKAEGWKPDVILMDVRMPVMDGPTAINILRGQPETEHTPIIVLSAYSDSKTRDACKRAGADTFLTKPVDIEKIDTVIKAHLGHSKNQSR